MNLGQPHYSDPQSTEYFTYPSMVTSRDSFDESEFFSLEGGRQRANTWPRQQFGCGDYAQSFDGFVPYPQEVSTLQAQPSLPQPPALVSLPLKKSSLKNPWGDQSYADLIAAAIESTPDKRMTLAQIYDWIMVNVPYFKDKSVDYSAGWKNSIRHNLSLRTRFMRCQNETPGKSSWWMIDPMAKAKKSARPRAGSAGMADRPNFRAKKSPTLSTKRCDKIEESVATGQSSSAEYFDQSSQTMPFPPANIVTTTQTTVMTNTSDSVQSSVPTVMPTVDFSDNLTGYYDHDPGQLVNFDGWMFPEEADLCQSLYDLEFNKLWQV